MVSGAASRGASMRPNVLFIAVDDLNDWVGCLQTHPQAKTPNIDALAERGCLFTNAHCQGPICGPSRASLLSGLYPHQTGVYQQPSGKGLELDRDHFRGKLLPEYFADHGYETLGVGKITHGYSPKIAFDAFGGTFDGFGPKPKERFHYHLPDVPWSGTQTDWGMFPDSDKKMPDHQAADWAVDQLKRSHQQPFFLAVGFVRPHVPFYVPQKWFEPFPLDTIVLPEVDRGDLADVPPIGRQIHEMPKYPDLQYLSRNDNEQFRRCVQAYLACIYFMDHQVGRVIDALQSSEHADNTIVVLFSDHGYHLGEKNRVSKHSLWEESTRIPLVIRRPGDSSSLRCDRPVGLIDLYPTLIELCDLPRRSDNAGHSLVTLLDEPTAPFRQTVMTTYARKNHSLRGDRFRYIRYEDGSEELYDHDADPYEWTNLANAEDQQQRLADFRSMLPDDESEYHPATSSSPVNAWFADHLRRNGVTKRKR
tara:strand:- start:9645 stop:11078 length:1434 start_codon:yes stop_codon:yes gene_type:complete